MKEFGNQVRRARFQSKPEWNWNAKTRWISASLALSLSISILLFPSCSPYPYSPSPYSRSRIPLSRFFSHFLSPSCRVIAYYTIHVAYALLPSWSNYSAIHCVRTDTHEVNPRWGPMKVGNHVGTYALMTHTRAARYTHENPQIHALWNARNHFSGTLLHETPLSGLGMWLW